MKNHIAIVSAYATTSSFIAQEIQAFLPADYEIGEYTIDMLPKDQQKLALLVCSSSAVKRQAAPDSSIPCVVTERNLELSKMPEILSIESGTRVYAFGSSREASLELIQHLERSGIHHLELYPCYPGIELYQADIVITPGKITPDLKNVKKIINVEYKRLNISTLIEIGIKLGLPSSSLETIEKRYQQEITTLNRYNTMINQNIKGIFEIINEGIFCMEETGHVIFCNKLFLMLTELEYHDIIGKPYQEIPFGANFRNLLDYNGDFTEELLDYCSRKLLINKRKQKNCVVLSVQDVTEIQKAESNVRKKLARKGFVAKYTLEHMVGTSSIMEEKKAEAYKIAQSDYDVLLQGENGTGKEMFAQAIHSQSPRAKYPFVAVNLASLPDQIIESELFGYEEGAFTGASRGGKAGLFEMAHNGTIFIDEIGDVSLHIQQSLLRVLQEKEVMRVGGDRIIPVNVRVIAATNQNLFRMVQEGQFRMDLYYRLKVLHILVPPLRERKEDISLLAEFFFKQIKSKKYLKPETAAFLKAYSWPGNVRELQNLVYYLETLCSHDAIALEDIPPEYGQKPKSREAVQQEIGEDDFSLMLFSIGTEEMQRELCFILEMLEEGRQQQVTLSRKRLCELYQKREKGKTITVEQMRTRFRKLQQMGLIQTGKTKQGSVITEKGRIFLTLVAKKFPVAKG